MAVRLFETLDCRLPSFGIVLRGDVAASLGTISIAEGLVMQLDENLDILTRVIPYFVRSVAPFRRPLPIGTPSVAPFRRLRPFGTPSVAPFHRLRPIGTPSIAPFHRPLPIGTPSSRPPRHRSWTRVDETATALC
jgi:hypothetical protein